MPSCTYRKKLALASSPPAAAEAADRGVIAREQLFDELTLGGFDLRKGDMGGHQLEERRGLQPQLLRARTLEGHFKAAELFGGCDRPRRAGRRAGAGRGAHCQMCREVVSDAAVGGWQNAVHSQPIGFDDGHREVQVHGLADDLPNRVGLALGMGAGAGRAQRAQQGDHAAGQLAQPRAPHGFATWISVLVRRYRRLLSRTLRLASSVTSRQTSLLTSAKLRCTGGRRLAITTR